MSGNKKYLIVIAGPTAVGKTAIGIELAKHFECDIISADSRQFYREISIGTAKPTLEELGAVKHHFINSHSVIEDYSAGKYENDVLNLLTKIYETKDICLLVGGSGLFVKAVTLGFDDLPDIDKAIRSDLNRELETKGLHALVTELQDKDPTYFEVVDRSNPQRIIRALEIVRATGKRYTDYRKSEPKPRPFSIIKIGLEQDRSELYRNIDLRVDKMIMSGLLQEAKGVSLFKDKASLKTVGYSEIYDFLEGKYSWDQAVSLIKQNSRRYAKRQLTWFKKDGEFEWFYPTQIDVIKNYLDKKIQVWPSA